MQSQIPININLLEPSPRSSHRFNYYVLGFLILAITGVLTGYFYILQNRELANQQALNTELKTEVQKYEKEMAIFKPIEELSKEIASKNQKVNSLEKTQESYAKVMMEIDKALPSKVIVAGVEIKGQKIVLTGFSPDHSQVARLLDGLKRSTIFKNVTVLGSKINEKTNEAEFTIDMDWEAEKK